MLVQILLRQLFYRCYCISHLIEFLSQSIYIHSFGQVFCRFSRQSCYRYFGVSHFTVFLFIILKIFFLFFLWNFSLVILQIFYIILFIDFLHYSFYRFLQIFFHQSCDRYFLREPFYRIILRLSFYRFLLPQSFYRFFFT